MPYRSVPLFWRLKKPKYNLVGTKCLKCKNVYFPPRNLCPECRRSGNIREFPFSGKGKIVSYTIIRTAPEGFEHYTPYVVAIVHLDEGANIAAQIVGDIENIKTGKRVRSVFRKMCEDGSDGLIHYGLKFEMAD
ncbi:MAG: transcriptional regulator [Candidatus Aenigmarchaeota archaeon]|nr:transcriptional regulator [Candidatus Aenigmarchaeota archaeon]